MRVLHRVGTLGNNGLEAVVMNYYRHIDKEKVQFDFVVNTLAKQRYDDEIKKNGGNIYKVPYSRLRHPLAYIKEFSRILKSGNYQIVHLHNNSASIALEALCCKLNKVPWVIGHSHSNKCKYRIQHYVFKPFLNILIDDFFACSKPAAEWLFGKSKVNKGLVKIVNNAIQVEKFLFNEKKRKEIREELNIFDKKVIGHVGRFTLEKNHEFIVEVFNEIHKKLNDSVLILVGDGPGRNQIERKVESLGLKSNVYFLGNRCDVNELYSAFDVLLFPSLFEGLGLVVIEAQAAGLKCFVSDRLPKEVQFSELVSFVKLSKKPIEWADEIIQYMKKGFTRMNMNELFEESKYDIKKQAKWLENYYLKQANSL